MCGILSKKQKDISTTRNIHVKDSLIHMDKYGKDMKE